MCAEWNEPVHIRHQPIYRRSNRGSLCRYRCGLVQEGTPVKQGDILVKVKSIAGGSIAAARATTAGKVSQVLVKPGDKIEAQQVVAKVSE